MVEERLINIETKIAFQDQTIQDLNDVLYQQQQEIERIASVCDLLVKQIKELSELSQRKCTPEDEKPPHY